jgi:phosphatidylinositol alpha-1,6-mannosyltransferase
MRPAIGDKNQLVHIAPGISIDHFLPGVKPEDLLQKYDLVGKKVIVSVGRLVHRKGQDRLVEAMPQILAAVPEAVLVLVGTGPHQKVIEKLARKHGVTDSIRFIGRVQYSDLPRHIHVGDIFAMPSRSRFFGLEVEGLGIVYLEASACGLPVIAGNSGGAPDAVIDGETGLVVDGTDINDIAAAAIVLLRNPEKAKAMGAAGRQWVEREWSWDLWGERFAALLKKS